MRERPDFSLLQRWEDEHFQQVARKRRFLDAHLDIFIGYSAKARGWVAAWSRDRSPVAAEYDLRTLMNALEALGWLAEQRAAAPAGKGTRQSRAKRRKRGRHRRRPTG